MKIHQRSLPETRKRLKLNWRLLLTSLVLIAIVLPSVYFLHRSQMGRVSNAMLERSKGFQEKKEWLSASDAIETYLLLDPDNAEQKVVLAEVLDEALPDKLATSSFGLLNRILNVQARAIGVCEAYAELKEREAPIRRRMMQRLYQAGRYEDAIDQIAKLAGPAIDGGLMKWFSMSRYAMALEGRTHSYTDATQVAVPDWLYSASNLKPVDLLLKAIIDNPGDVEISQAIAEACLGNPEFLAKSQLDNQTPQELRDRAVSVMDKMLASNRENLVAWLAHYSVASRVDIVRAESDIRQALSMAPADPDVLRSAGAHFMERALNSNRAAEQEKKSEWLDVSEKYFNQVLDQGLKRDSSVYLGLGEIAFAKGDFEKAIEYWEDGARVSAAPTATLWFRIAQAWAGKRNLEQMQAALKSMDESIRLESSLLTKRGQTMINRVANQQWATFYALRGDYVKAAKYLEDVVARDQEMDSLNKSEIIASLGQCYLRSGQYDRAVEAYQDAAVMTPTIDDRHRGLSDALAGSNRIRDALERMEIIREKNGKDFARICELILEYQSQNRPDPALWSRFDTAIKDATAISPNDTYLIERPWLLDVLQLDSTINRASPDLQKEVIALAQKRLIELSEQSPESYELQRLVIQRLEKLGFAEDSRRIFSKLEAANPGEADVVLIKVENLLKDGMKDDAKKLLDSKLAADPLNPLLQSASMRLAVGMRTPEVGLDAEKSYANNVAALSEAGQSLIETPIFVDDLADESKLLQATKEWCSKIEAVEKSLREAEGLEGTEWRYLRARRLLAEYQAENKSDIAEVEVLSNFLVQRRPSWNATYVLAGMVEDAKGSVQNAIREYNRAIRLGAQSIRTYERLAELMLTQGQSAEVAAMIDRLGDRVNRSKRLSSIAIGLSEGNQKGMLQLAEAGAQSRPRDPMAWVWLGQVTELVSRGFAFEDRNLELKKAEDAINRARELSEEKSIPVFSAAFGLYLASKQNEKIDALLADLAKAPIDPTIKYLALADFYQVLDRMELAQNALMEARKSSKDPNFIDDRMARLMLAQGKQDEAINLYKTLFANLPEDGSIRRSYVTLLAARGSDTDWSLIDQIYQNEKVAENPDDRRLRAELLARKGQQKDLALAQFLLESLVEDPKNRTDQDRYRLASIYLRNAALAEIQDAESPQIKQLLSAAGKQYATLCRSSQVPVEYLYAYGDFLIKQERVVEATEIADRLNAQDPDHFATVLLRARLQVVAGNPERAKSLIVAWKDARLGKLLETAEASEKAKILVQAGEALSELGSAKEAEEMLRQGYELDGNVGAIYVRSLARTQDAAAKDSAVRYLLDKLKAEKSPETARLLAGLLSIGSVASELEEQGDEVLTELGGANDKNAELLLSIADMWLAQKKSTKAIDAYKKIVALRPNDVLALNNLAILLGEQPDKTNEALELIDQAIRIAGKQPLLLDSKAAILMLASRYDEAIPILEIAASATGDPRVTFHLFLALQKAGRDEEANRVKGKVDVLGLRKSILTPDDQKELDRFESISKD